MSILTNVSLESCTQYPNSDVHHVMLSPVGNALSKEGPWLAGGALRSMVEKQSMNDIDLFFKNADQRKNMELLLDSLGGIETFRCPEGKLTTYKLYGWKIQCIGFKYWNSLEEVVNSFDFTACMLGTDGTRLMYHPRTMKDISQKRLWFTNLHMPVAALKHALKYATYGYRVNQSSAEAFIFTIYEAGRNQMPIDMTYYVD